MDAMRGRISGDNPIELRIVVRDCRAPQDAPHWLGFAALAGSVKRGGVPAPSVRWTASGETKRWNWLGAETAASAAGDAFESAVADLLRQLYLDVDRVKGSGEARALGIAVEPQVALSSSR